MGTEAPARDLNLFGKIVSLSFFIFAPALYFLPLYEAWSRKHENLLSLGILNLFLGWTLLGWIAALIWSTKMPPVVSLTTSETASSSKATEDRKFDTSVKICPFCAEKIQLAAIKCKHCGSLMAQ